MIEFKPITIDSKSLFEKYLFDGNEHGCEYSFANLYMWGKQSAAVIEDHLVLFSQYNRCSVYPFPVGSGDKKAVLDALIEDSRERGISCRFNGLGEHEKQILTDLYPGIFTFHCDRDFFDYVYSIDDLADLKGRKYHGKRNHYKKFCENNPDYNVVPIVEFNKDMAKEMVNAWYEERIAENPYSDYKMEQIAISKAFSQYEELAMDGIMIIAGGKVVAVTMGSMLSADTFDVHFEKASRAIDGLYAAVNCEFAKYVRDKYPNIKFLNREDDMGIEGLRKAKESYRPHHMVEKCWACYSEDGYED